MKIFKIKSLIITVMFLLPLLSKAQTPLQRELPNNQQKMENKVVIGKVIVPKSSLEEFRNQNITGKFLKTLPGFLKGESYESIDEAGNLTLVTFTTWLNQESYVNAERCLKAYYEQIKFNAMDYRVRLKIVAEHAVYSKFDY
jgi:hypothetical protein